jgi:hypothetical protein
MSRIDDVFTMLKNNEIDVYFPNQKTGECLTPYVVVKYAGGEHYVNYSSRQDFVDLLIYVPQNNYSNLIPYKNQIKEHMKSLYPMFVDTGYESPSFLEEQIKAHMINIQYRNNKKL